ncbi:MAG TPA: TlpA disulfide reductase family protein, partial [Alphaproteobacteria bacterium]|nr:TlpA disulfide reductase family protein [Alphaproteobacteria bacterium]
MAALLTASAVLFSMNYVGLPGSDDKAAAAQTSAPVPSFSFALLDGGTGKIDDLKEKIILIHFWASWCAPCKVEFPHLLDYVKRANGKVALLAIAVDDKREASKKFLKSLRLETDTPHVIWAWDSDKTLSFKLFNTAAMPETIIVDENRRMVDKIVGPGGWDKRSP